MQLDVLATHAKHSRSSSWEVGKCSCVESRAVLGHEQRGKGRQSSGV